MNAPLWILQAGLSVFFLFQGGLKIFKPATLKAKGLNDLALLLFIGFCEILGALGLVLPSVTGILPWLTPVAAFGLSLIMVLAFRYHIRRREAKDAFLTLALLILTASVALGRWMVQVLQ